MTERALRLAPDDDDVQFTHAMLLLDGERPGSTADRRAARAAAAVRGRRCGSTSRADGQARASAVRRGRRCRARRALPDADRRRASRGQRGDARRTATSRTSCSRELGEAILEHAPDRLARLVPLLPDERESARRSSRARRSRPTQRDAALALYDRAARAADSRRRRRAHELPARDEQRVHPGARGEGVRRGGRGSRIARSRSRTRTRTSITRPHARTPRSATTRRRSSR